jgi:hypothetical protein
MARPGGGGGRQLLPPAHEVHDGPYELRSLQAPVLSGWSYAAFIRLSESAAFALVLPKLLRDSGLPQASGAIGARAAARRLHALLPGCQSSCSPPRLRRRPPPTAHPPPLRRRCQTSACRRRRASRRTTRRRRSQSQTPCSCRRARRSGWSWRCSAWAACRGRRRRGTTCPASSTTPGRTAQVGGRAAGRCSVCRRRCTGCAGAGAGCTACPQLAHTGPATPAAGATTPLQVAQRVCVFLKQQQALCWMAAWSEEQVRGPPPPCRLPQPLAAAARHAPAAGR